MNDLKSTVRSRALGAELQQLRKRDGHRLADVAALLGWAQSTISRLENGQRYTSEEYLIRLLATYRVTGKDYDRLLDMSRKAFDRSWLETRGELPDERTLVLHETTAIKISEFDPLGIPELLRTDGYARALLRQAGLIPDRMAEPQVQACLDRQKVFRPEYPPAFTFFLSEQVLRSAIGGMRVMNDQLLRLTLESSRPRCTIRVLPIAIGPGGLLGGPFRIMEFAKDLPVAYTQTQTARLFLEEPASIAAYRTVLSRLNEIALGIEDSRELLLRLATEYDMPDEGGDEYPASLG